MKDKQFWNFCTFNYDFWHNLEYHSYKMIAENICNHLTGQEKILEVACGTGILTNEILTKYPSLDYTAIDFSEKMLDICKEKGIIANFQLMDAANLLFENSSFDVVIIANALHIIPNPNKVIEEMKRVLNENGIFYASNFLTPTTRKEKFILDITRLFGYHVYTEYTKESFLKLLRDNGLLINQEEIQECFRTLLYVECTKKRVLKKV